MNLGPAGGLGSGGGVQCRLATNVRILENVIVENTARYGGAGIVADHAAALFEANVIVNNVCTTPAGGGIHLAGPTTNSTIRFNTIIGNAGAGIFMAEGMAHLQYNIISSQRRVEPGHWVSPGLTCALGVLAVHCNDIWGNSGGDALCGNDLGMNISSDPQFCDSDPGTHRNFSLQSDSPCLPENNTCHERLGAAFAGCGEVKLEPLSWGFVKFVYR